MALAGGWRADPEEQAGRALRRLRLARDWSQEEVAVRMTAYGYDFHQTTIAKIEGAQRPLRVRELADFAALYGVEVQELVYPPSRSLPEINQEIADVRTRLDAARAAADAARKHLERLRMEMRASESAYQASFAEVAVLEGRLASLSTDREKVISWESDRGSSATAGASVTSNNEGGTTVLRVLLGTHLRRLRETAGITLVEAGEAAGTSRSRITKLETGRAAFKEREIIDLLNVYGMTDQKDRSSLLELARQANSPGWWHDYSDILPSWSEAYIGLEMSSAGMRVYGTRFVPELLQTKAYSRAVISPDYGNSYGDASTKAIERRIRLRTERQARFFDERPDPPVLWVVLDEAVLRRQVGSPAVMRDQLKHITEIAERPNVTVQVLPLEASSSSAQGSFNILRFAEDDMRDVVYVEQLTSALYLDRPEDVEAYMREMERLSLLALPPHQTTLLLRKLL